MDVYVVIGLGRSGTSTITRSLQALGVDLGDQTTGNLNAKGSFEDFDVSRVINRRVLEALNYSWKNMALTDLAVDHEKLILLKAKAVAMLNQRLQKTKRFAFKAISTAKMLPFWQDVFRTLNVNDHYIIALRNPLAAAFSYQRINGADIELSLLQWLMHMIPAIERTAHRNRIVVHFDALLQSPEKEMQRMQTQLNISMLSDAEEKNKFIHEFLDVKLKHYDSTVQDLNAHSAMKVAPLCVKMYSLLWRVSKDEISFESDEFVTNWKCLREEFDALHPLYSYIEVLLTKNKSLERQIRGIRKSIAWKLSYPLRLLDQSLRARRRKSREKRKLLIA